jgi:hypothetical protein
MLTIHSLQNEELASISACKAARDLRLSNSEESSERSVTVMDFGVYRRPRGKFNCFSEYGVIGRDSRTSLPRISWYTSGLTSSAPLPEGIPVRAPRYPLLNRCQSSQATNCPFTNPWPALQPTPSCSLTHGWNRTPFHLLQKRKIIPHALEFSRSRPNEMGFSLTSVSLLGLACVLSIPK